METAFKSIKYMFLFFICLSDFVCVWRPDSELTWNILLPKMILTSEMQKHQWKKVARAWKFCSGLESRFWKHAAYIWVGTLGCRPCVWTWTGPWTERRCGCLTVSGWAWAASGLPGQFFWPGAHSQPPALLRTAQERSGFCSWGWLPSAISQLPVGTIPFFSHKVGPWNQSSLGWKGLQGRAVHGKGPFHQLR